VFPAGGADAAEPRLAVRQPVSNAANTMMSRRLISFFIFGTEVCCGVIDRTKRASFRMVAVFARDHVIAMPNGKALILHSPVLRFCETLIAKPKSCGRFVSFRHGRVPRLSCVVTRQTEPIKCK
jgi:hypothetical protein